MSERRVRFIAMARERQRVEAANELERSRQARQEPDGTQEEQDERETEEWKRAQREAMDRRLRARARIANVKRVFAEHPELKAACHLISMGVALLVIKWLLENGERAW